MYKRKIQRPMPDKEFIDGVTNGHFTKEYHRGFLVFLFYSACRVSEALWMKHDDFTMSDSWLYCHITRLKNSKDVPEIALPIEAYHMNELIKCIRFGESGKVWDFCRSTAFNIIKRVWPNYYPHYLRLSRITNLLGEYPISDVLSFTGLHPKNLAPYSGIVSVKNIGEGFKRRYKT